MWGFTILFLIGIIIFLIIITLLVNRNLERETSKKEALLWIISGTIPSPAAYNKVHDILAKYRYDEQCADILAKLTALKTSSSSTHSA